MPYKRTKKKKFLSVVALAAFTYTSIIFTAGMLIGYVLSRMFYKKYVENGFLDSLYFDFKGWKIHLHHWIMGALVIMLIIVSGWEPHIPMFFWGALAGVIAHDIYDFDDWHKVVIKQRIQ